MKEDLILYGAGGAGRELAFSLSLGKNEDLRWSVKGFVDDDRRLWHKKVDGIPVLGGYEYLNGFKGAVAVAVVGRPNQKRDLISQIQKITGISFPRIIGPHNVVSDNIRCGEGCIIALAFNWIGVGVQLGDFVFVNSSTRIGHDAQVGDFTTIFNGVNISGGSTIGSGCVIGSGATINPGVTVGSGSIIGAGAVVVKDIPERVVAYGTPARVIREIRD